MVEIETFGAHVYYTWTTDHEQSSSFSAKKKQKTLGSDGF